ncbi:MAG TPA: hypothetical protein VHA14_14475 [Bryobacteraceae bacterium]|nr:hypothetical protein [Bryobacteraceae bacterium]
MRTIAGVFPTESEAVRTRGDLMALGISDDEIIVASGNKECLDKVAEENDYRITAALAPSGAGLVLAGLFRKILSGRSAPAAAAVGAVAGLVFGAIGALIAHAVRPPALAHVNGFLIAGGIMVAGALLGAVLAWIFALGVSHEGIAFCAEAEREHGVVVAAHVSETIEPDAIRVMTEHGAAKLRSDADPWRAAGWRGPHPENEAYPSDSSRE